MGKNSKIPSESQAKLFIGFFCVQNCASRKNPFLLTLFTVTTENAYILIKDKWEKKWNRLFFLTFILDIVPINWGWKCKINTKDNEVTTKRKR